MSLVQPRVAAATLAASTLLLAACASHSPTPRSAEYFLSHLDELNTAYNACIGTERAAPENSRANCGAAMMAEHTIVSQYAAGILEADAVLNPGEFQDDGKGPGVAHAERSGKNAVLVTWTGGALAGRHLTLGVLHRGPLVSKPCAPTNASGSTIPAFVIQEWAKTPQACE